jgi:hypothetical protein
MRWPTQVWGSPVPAPPACADGKALNQKTATDAAMSESFQFI